MKKFLAVFGIVLALGHEANAQQVVLPCFKIGTSCVPTSLTNPLPVDNVVAGTITNVVGTNTASLAASTTPRSLIYADVAYTTSATVGNRQVVLRIFDASGNARGTWSTSPALTASGVYFVNFLPGTYRESAFDTFGSVQTPFPAGLPIPPGYVVKVLDDDGISPSDSQVVNFATVP